MSRGEPRRNKEIDVGMIELVVSVQNWLRGRMAEIDERGATAVEYALMVGLIAVAIIGTVTLLGTKLKRTFNSISNTLPTGAG
jgi:pilus assembly protein Flp/PilA